MIRTLIFGAIAGYVGKKLYDEGKLTEFKDDLVTRYNDMRGNISTRSDSGSSRSGTSAGLNTNSSGTPAMVHSGGSATHSAAPSIS